MAALNLREYSLRVPRFSRPKSYDGVITQHGDWNEVCTLGIDGLKKNIPYASVHRISFRFTHLADSYQGRWCRTAASRCLDSYLATLEHGTEEELKDDAEYADILEDVKDEMSKSGEVLSERFPDLRMRMSIRRRSV